MYVYSSTGLPFTHGNHAFAIRFDAFKQLSPHLRFAQEFGLRLNQSVQYFGGLCPQLFVKFHKSGYTAWTCGYMLQPVIGGNHRLMQYSFNPPPPGLFVSTYIGWSCLESTPYGCCCKESYLLLDLQPDYRWMNGNSLPSIILWLPPKTGCSMQPHVIHRTNRAQH